VERLAFTQFVEIPSKLLHSRAGALLLKTATFHLYSLFFLYGSVLQLSRLSRVWARAACRIARGATEAYGRILECYDVHD